jgi:hypothetical protein
VQTKLRNVLAHGLDPVEAPLIVQESHTGRGKRFGDRADHELRRGGDGQVRLNIALTVCLHESYLAVLHHGEGCAGRSQLLPSEHVDREHLLALDGIRDAILGVGERRFVHGVLGCFTRTAAFRMNVHAPRMEPASVVELGVIGLHFRAGQTTQPQLMQLIGDAPAWNDSAIDEIVGLTMSLTAVGGAASAPLPVQLAERELNALGPFLEHYSRSVTGELKRRELESIWLSDWDLAT